MIAALAIWLYVFLLSWVYGWLTLRAVAALAALRPTSFPPFPIVALVGLVSLSTLTGFLALFTRIGLEVNLALLGAAIVLAVREGDGLRPMVAGYLAALRRASRVVLVLFLIAALITLERTASPPTNYDTGYYHAQAIRWLEEYGLVPGLANLHSQLGYSHAWFGLSALFSFSFLELRSFHVLDGAVFVLFLMFALGSLRDWLAGRRAVSVAIKVALVAAGLTLLAKWFSSPTPDIPAALLVWVVGLLFLERIEQRADGQCDARAVAIVLLSAYAMAVKLSVLPIGLLAAYLLYRERRRPRAAVVLLGGGAVVLAPFVLQTIWTSGYLLYPFPMLDLLSVDWKVRYEVAYDDYRWVQSWARIPHRHPNLVLAMPVGEWVPIWFRRFPELEKRALLLLLALTPFYVGWTGLTLLRRMPSASGRADRAVLFASVVLGLLFWFQSAPDARFGWGFLLLLALLLAGWALRPLLGRLPGHAPSALFGLFLVFHVNGAYLSRATPFAGVTQNAVLPADYPVRPLRTKTARNFTLLAPTQGNQCFYAPLPCTHQDERKIALRGTTLKEGFRFRGR